MSLLGGKGEHEYPHPNQISRRHFYATTPSKKCCMGLRHGDLLDEYPWELLLLKGDHTSFHTFSSATFFSALPPALCVDVLPFNGFVPLLA